MKIRRAFVSNSSSYSYLTYLPAKMNVRGMSRDGLIDMISEYFEIYIPKSIFSEKNPDNHEQLSGEEKDQLDWFQKHLDEYDRMTARGYRAVHVHIDSEEGPYTDPYEGKGTGGFEVHGY